MGELYNPFPKLPKNIRQIGDSDQVVRFYMEDYVNTYLKRLYPAGKQTMRVGVLLGSVEQYDGVPYVFVDGAMEMEEIETDGEKVSFSDGAWKKIYRQMEDSFPKRTIQGWFLCGGPGSQLSPLNYWKQHGQYFAGKNQLMYLNHGLDGEESIYITSEDGFYKLKGHCIYYERNQMMQDYMITRKDVHRVESGAQETVIRDFRSRLSAKKEHAVQQSRANHAMGVLCGVLTVAVLAGGVALVNNYTKMQQMKSVLASVLPSDYEDFIIEEIAGHIMPTKTNDEAESFLAETSETVSEVISGAISGTESNDVVSESAEAQTEYAENSQGESEEKIEEIEEETGKETGKETGEGDETVSAAQPIDYEAAAANGYKIYEVKEGETLYGICWRQYSNLNHLAEICRLNNLTDVDRILAGQRLILP